MEYLTEYDFETVRIMFWCYRNKLSSTVVAMAATVTISNGAIRFGRPIYSE